MSENPQNNIEEVPQESGKPAEKIVTYSDDYRQAIIDFYREIAAEFPEKRSEDENRYVPNLSPDNPNSNYWLALNENSEIDGTLSLKDCGKGVGYVSNFYVRKDRRVGTIGGRLVRAMDEFAKERGFTKLFAVTMPDNASAQKMYAKRMKKVEVAPTDAMTFHDETVFFEKDLTEE